MANNNKITIYVKTGSTEVQTLQGNTLVLGGNPAHFLNSLIELHNKSENAHPYIQEKIEEAGEDLSEHIADKSNPHEVTAQQVGLGNVDNTADLDKPISTETQTALNAKQDTLSSAQMDAVNSGANATNIAQIGTNASAISTIEEKIPSQASSSNQLADKDFVNSSVGTNTANYISNNGQPFTSLAELEAYTGTVTNNDYAFVVTTDAAGNTVYNRYKYSTATTPASWAFEYALNNSSFTANQWAAINSGITSAGVSQIAANTTAISGKQDTLVSGTNIKTVNGSSILGSGNVNIDALPSQTGQSGKFLTTNGTDASWASVSVPNNVYTSDNLKAGTNITLITEQESSGIDENTVALCHLDNSQTNVVTMSDMTYAWVWPGYSNTIKKFGDYSGRLVVDSGYTRLFYSAASSPFYAKTVDFWIYINEKEAYSTDNASNFAAFGGLSTDDVSYGFRLKYENNSLNLYATSDPMNSAVTPYYSQTIQEKTWYHLAIEYIYTSHSSSSTAYVFNWYVNGHKVHAQTGSWSYDASFSDNCLTAYNNGNSSTGNICFIDEIRISDIARYGGNDFTPETAAYGSVVREVTKINNTLDTSTFATKTEIANKLENTATGNHSLTLLGTVATSTYAVNIGESTTTNTSGVSLGYSADAAGQNSVAIGRNAYAGESNKPYAIAIGNSTTASGERAIAIGSASNAIATRAIMLGPGTNNTSNTFAVGLNSTTYRLLESTGKIPVDRLTAMGGATSSAAGTVGAVPAPAAGDEGKFLKGDGTWAEVADTDLSNLSSAGEEKFDGSWVIGDIALVSSATSINSGETKTYSLASYLEADKVYEVLVYVYAQTTGTNGARCNIKVNGVLLCANRTNASTGVGLGGASIIPVTNRTISVYNEANYTGELSSVTVAAYRRVK